MHVFALLNSWSKGDPEWFWMLMAVMKPRANRLYGKIFFTHHRIVFLLQVHAIQRLNIVPLLWKHYSRPQGTGTFPHPVILTIQRQGHDSLLKHHKLKIISLITNFSTAPLPQSIIQARGCISQINQCQATSRKSALSTCPIRPDVSDVSVLIIETMKILISSLLWVSDHLHGSLGTRMDSHELRFAFQAWKHRQLLKLCCCDRTVHSMRLNVPVNQCSPTHTLACIRLLMCAIMWQELFEWVASSFRKLATRNAKL